MITRGASPIEERLERRRRVLVSEVIPELERDLESGDAELTHAALVAAHREIDDIDEALARARADAERPWDEHQLEVGDTVDVREVGARDTERFVLVSGGPGARIHQGWISDRSPLGAELVGRRRHDVVAVKAPGGTIRYEVMDFQRAVVGASR